MRRNGVLVVILGAVVALVLVWTGSGLSTPAAAPKSGPCSPGYWKQTQNLDSWYGYSPNQTLESVFDVPDSLGLDNKTLLEALSFQGSNTIQGASQTLLRSAVAALLNAAHPGVNYSRTVAQVTADVNAALASGNRNTILALSSSLDSRNAAGKCTLAGAPAPTPTSTPTNTPTNTPTITPTNTPTDTPTPTPQTPTNTPTDTPTPTPA
jgi:hypothetical protein